MKIFSATQRFLRFFGFIPLKCRFADKLNFVENFIVFSFLSFLIVSMIIKLTKTDDFFELLNEFIICFTSASYFCSYGILLFQRTKVVQLVEDLEQSANEHIEISTAVQAIYEKTNARVEKLSRTFIFSAFGVVLMSYLHRSLTAVYILTIGGENSTDSLQYVLPMA